MMATFALFGAIGVIGLSVVWRGYVLSVLWAWFAVGLFAVPPLNIPQAIGVALIVSALTYRRIKSESASFEPVADALMQPAVLLLVGWIVKGCL